jgi:hypothetical protein
MPDHDVLGRMSEQDLIRGLRKIAAPMLAELNRRGITVSIASAGEAAPEFVFAKDGDGGRRSFKPSQA